MLQIKYKTKEEIPQEYVALYTERDGEWHFTGVNGIKTQADIDRMQAGLTKERDEHKGTKEKLRAWEGLERSDVDAKLARLEELEVAAKDSISKAEMDKKLDELAEVRVKNRMLPVERERDGLKKKLEETEKAVAALTAEKNQRIVHDKIREAAVAAKVMPEVMADVLLLSDNVFELTEDGKGLLTKENAYGVDAGLTPESFFQTQQERRSYWWPASTGGGSKGSGGKGGAGGGSNPWAAETWNLTEQGKYVREHGMEKAQQMAKLAGATVNGPKPTAKK